MSDNIIFHPADLENTDQWMLAHTTIGTKKYNELGQPRGFSKEFAPEWYQNLDESELESYWNMQEQYLQKCLKWIDSIGVTEAHIVGIDEDREKEMLAKFNIQTDGVFQWQSDLVDVVPELNIQNLYLKANDGSELIIFESDTETVFIHDAMNSLPEELRNPQEASEE